MISLNVRSELENDLIGGLFGCDVDQINEKPNENGTFLDLVFTNVPVDMAFKSAKTPLLKLNRHHKESKSKCESAAVNLRLWRVVSNATGSNWWIVWMNLMVWTGAAFFRVEESTNAWTYSTIRSGAALKDMCLRYILAVNKNFHG
jgi:hypothetical protein